VNVSATSTKKTEPRLRGLAIARILLVSDDPETGRVWSFSIQQKGWKCLLVDLTDDALAVLNEDGFDLIVIDVRRRLFEGLELCERLRTEAVIPILFLTAQGDEAQVLEAYDAGASECVVKPVGPAVFLAKVQAWLRVSWVIAGETLGALEVGGLFLDPIRRGVVTPRADFIRLSNLEFRVLYLLMNNCDRAMETETLVDRVWGYHATDGSVLLKNVVYRLRHKLEPNPSRPRHITTVPGVGYMFTSR
jgi:DNA-binding response OmpR family regulator